MIDAFLFSYLFLYLLFSLLNTKYWLNVHQRLISILAIFYLNFILLEGINQWYTGYFFEILAFYQRTAGVITWGFIIGKILIFLALLLNLFSKNRSKSLIQFFVNSFIFIYLISKHYLTDFSTMVVPSWHTTIYPSLNIYAFLISMFTFFCLDFLFLKGRSNKKMTWKDRKYKSEYAGLLSPTFKKLRH